METKKRKTGKTKTTAGKTGRKVAQNKAPWGLRKDGTPKKKPGVKGTTK